ncbi:hypothetical protein [Legionella genomosp. 1]|uniref:hypothetical protein n=1 Tax=Legionella genomosp. 1 TaxID=1093625 RepID=UPI0010551EBD|nr:hypothetical protein [Legionella genomosp. 1]
MPSKNELIDGFLQMVHQENRRLKPGESHFDWIVDELLGTSERVLQDFFSKIADHAYSNKLVDRHTSSNQTIWNVYTMLVAKHFAMNMRRDTKLLNMIKEMGQHRAFMADLLKHGTDDERPKYGKIRGEESSPTEICLEFIGPKNTTYSKFYNPIMQRLAQDFAPQDFVSRELEAETGRQLISPSLHYVAQKFELGKGQTVKYKTTCRDEKPELSDQFNVHIFEYKNTQYVSFTYPMMDAKPLSEQIQKPQELFETLLKWDVKKDPVGFYKNLAVLNRELYRILPIRLGSAALAEWIILSIAQAKDVDLGNVRTMEIPRDFMAFATRSSESYANWYLDNVFENVRNTVHDNFKNSIVRYVQTMRNELPADSPALMNLNAMYNEFKQLESSSISAYQELIQRLRNNHPVEHISCKIEHFFDEENYPKQWVPPEMSLDDPLLSAVKAQIDILRDERARFFKASKGLKAEKQAGLNLLLTLIPEYGLRGALVKVLEKYPDIEKGKGSRTKAVLDKLRDNLPPEEVTSRPSCTDYKVAVDGIKSQQQAPVGESAPDLELSSKASSSSGR